MAEHDDYFIYHYEHLDDLSFCKKPEDAFLGHPNGLDAILQSNVLEVSEVLKKAGWEGDGELLVMWLPPFVDCGVEDTYGICVWIVKQDNNGTSWLASPCELPFLRLREQNQYD